MRDSMIFYRSFYEAIAELPAENQIEVYDAIFMFAFNFTEVELKGFSKTIFTLIKPQLEANNKRFLNGKQPKRKQEESKPEAKEKQEESKIEANKNNNVNDNVNDNDNVKKKVKEKNTFSPPTLFEVVNYFKENGFTEQAGEKAWKYYDAGNWKDSKGQKVASWKQKMRGVWFKDENKILDSNNQTSKVPDWVKKAQTK